MWGTATRFPCRKRVAVFLAALVTTPLVNTPHRIRKTVGLHLGATHGVIALLDPTDSVIRFAQDDLPPDSTDDPDTAHFQRLRTLLAQTLDDRRYVLDV